MDLTAFDSTKCHTGQDLNTIGLLTLKKLKSAKYINNRSNTIKVAPDTYKGNTMFRFIIIMFSLCCLNILRLNAQVNPLLKAKYSQKSPYNDACPDGAAAGCGPVAIAQIMNMYKLPSHGFGMTSYTSGNYDITVDFSHVTFDWENILDEYKSGAYTETEAKAVADLVYACGAAMHATYGTATSVGNYARMLYGLQHYLHFSKDCRYLRRKFYSTAEWIEILNQQLSESHPVLYRGTWFFNDSRADHMFVIDGMDAQGAYHVNFGHAGSGDKFTNLNVINQSGSYPGGRGVCYNASQAMVINCYPTPEQENYPSQSCILEDYVVLNNDETANSTSVKLGETFTLSCRLRNCSAEKATINYGWALVNDGEIIDIVGQGTYILSAGNQFTSSKHMSVSLPENLADGSYKLELYSKSDLEPEWAKVWACAPTDADVTVNNGMAKITVPENHRLNPLLYLKEDIKEVDNEFAKSVPGRCFALEIKNPSTNNFENTLKLDIVADNILYTYETTLPVYSQTSTIYHILVPQEKADLQSKNISSVTASYYYDIEDRYIEMTTSDLSSIHSLASEQRASSANVDIYLANGMLYKRVLSRDIESSYGSVLKSLPHGIYIIKEGNKTRKIVL